MEGDHGSPVILIHGLGGYVEMMEPVTFAQIAQVRDYVRLHRPADGPYDIVFEGATQGEDRAGNQELMQRWEEAGATWWIEALWEAPSQEEVLQRVKQGPPGR